MKYNGVTVCCKVPCASSSVSTAWQLARDGAMLHWLVTCLVCIGQGSGRPVQGRVGPGRGKPVYVTKVSGQVHFAYQRGTLRLSWVRVEHHPRPVKLRVYTGRFVLRGYSRSTLLFRQGFDLPGLAVTKAYTRTDRRLIRKMLFGASSQGLVFVPWQPKPDRLEVWDSFARKRFVFTSFPEPKRRARRGMRGRNPRNSRR